MAETLMMALEGPDASEMVATQEPPAYDDELHDTRSLLADLCEALQEDGRVTFVVVFAGERWPADVGTDLATILEQLPDIESLSGTFELDFYEQGLERTLHFAPRKGDLEVSCVSHHATWTAPATTVQVSRENVRAMLGALVKRFAALATAVRPRFVRHSWFVSWYGDVTTQLGV